MIRAIERNKVGTRECGEVSRVLCDQNCVKSS